VSASLDSGTRSFDESDFGRLLAGGVRGDRVRYGFFRRHRAELDAYLARVAAVDLASLAAAHLKALLIDAYNAYTIQAILDHPGITSIRDIDGVWSDARHLVGGHPLTLDEMEHKLLRPYFQDPRIHFAVNCASASCAPLPPWAYDGDRLDEQLEERAHAFLTDPRNVRVEQGHLRLSRYFEWYGSDFSAPDSHPRADNVASFVARYATPSVAAFIRAAGGDPAIRFLDYDWSLNAERVERPDEADTSAAAADSAHVAAATDTSATSDAPGLVERFRAWVVRLGPVAPLVYMAGYVVATLLFIPGSAITLGAGAAFGLVLGTALVSIASTTGAALAFLLARTVMRARVERWVAGNPKFAAIDRAVGVEGWKIVALTRLSPVFPFNLLNYAYGLTAARFWPYVLTSWITMLPGTVLYVYLGVAGADVAAAATGAADWGKTALQIVGLAATLAVTLFITRIARRALREAAVA